MGRDWPVAAVALWVLQLSGCWHTAVDGAPAGAPLKILYILRTYPRNYPSKLTYQFMTWLPLLDPEHDAVLIASIDEGHESAIRGLDHLQLNGRPAEFHTPRHCANNHGVGLCCQEAKAILRVR